MKKYISHLVFALLGCAALSACVDDDYMELDKGQNELVLTASKTEVVLNEQAHACISLDLPDRRIPVMILMSGVPFSSMILSRYFALVIVFI